MATKLMSIRRPDVCASCAEPLPARTRAWWDDVERHVTCTGCRTAEGDTTAVPSARRDAAGAGTLLPPPVPVDPGVGGRSAQEQYERRAAGHRRRQIAVFGEPVVGGVAHPLDVDLVPTAEPQAITSWAKGAEGERRLAAHLTAELAERSTVLNDRRVPATRGNLDHVVVDPSGVWIVDAKNFSGDVERRTSGRRWRRQERLVVNGRDQTKLVEKMQWQHDAVRAVVAEVGLRPDLIHRCLCFTDTGWVGPTSFRIAEVLVADPVALAAEIRSRDVLAPDAVRVLAHHLSASLPAL